jgi:hypothetical protein
MHFRRLAKLDNSRKWWRLISRATKEHMHHRIPRSDVEEWYPQIETSHYRLKEALDPSATKIKMPLLGDIMGQHENGRDLVVQGWVKEVSPTHEGRVFAAYYTRPNGQRSNRAFFICVKREDAEAVYMDSGGVWAPERLTYRGRVGSQELRYLQTMWFNLHQRSHACQRST